VSNILAAEDALVIITAHDFRFVNRRHRLAIFGGRGGPSFTAAFDEDMSLEVILVNAPCLKHLTRTHFKCILSRETFIAVPAREWLDCKMYPLMSL